jgi:adenylate cyclase
LERDLRLRPHEGRPYKYQAVGMGYFFARRLEKAAEIFAFTLQEMLEWPPTLRFMASCLAHLGRFEEAQQMVKRLRALTPIVIPNADHWRVAEDRDFFLNGLRLAAEESSMAASGDGRKIE